MIEPTPPPAPVAEPTVRPWWQRVTRDTVLFTTGLVLVVNEAVVRSEEPRYTLLILYSAMLGLPAIFRFDEQRRTNGGPK